MHKFIEDLAPLQHVHASFAEWERARHRADFFATCAFPDSHPVKQILADMGRDLLEHRYAADELIREVAKRHGDFRTWVNGFFFEHPKDWFQSRGDKYWDCPTISFGRGVKRSHTLRLAGLGSLRAMETGGRRFAEAVTHLVEQKRPKSKPNLVKKQKLFEKDCRRLGRQLGRTQVDQRDRLNVLLCLRRGGLPATAGQLVSQFLV